MVYFQTANMGFWGGKRCDVVFERGLTFCKAS